jgi:hypothetical protein
MPDIVGLNGGVVKTLPALTDALPIQETTGITKPTTIGGVGDAVLASPAFIAAVQTIVSAMIVGGTGTTVTYNSTTKQFTITVP